MSAAGAGAPAAPIFGFIRLSAFQLFNSVRDRRASRLTNEWFSGLKVRSSGSDTVGLDSEQDLVQAVVVANDVLRALEIEGRPVSLATLVARLGMTAPRVHRHLLTLVSTGMVE